MKIVRSDRVVNLNNFDAVRYRVSVFGDGDGFPVEAIRRETGFFGPNTVEEEIARPVTEEIAKSLVADIASAWTAGRDVFNVDEWYAAWKEGNRPTMGKSCEICNKPAKWFAAFGTNFPFLRVNRVLFEEGQIKSKACPFCGRELKEDVENESV